MLLAPARDWPPDDQVLRLVVRVLPDERAAESRSSWLMLELDVGRLEVGDVVVGRFAPVVPVVGRVVAPVPVVGRSPVAP